MARKAAQKAAQKKAAKQKKMLIVLGVVFVIALIYAGMTLSNLNSSSGVQAVPAASTTPAGTGTPSAGTSTTAAPATAPTATPGVATAPPGSLRAFTGLGRKDPFNDNGPSTASTSKRTSTPSSHLTSAVISVNGTKLNVKVDAQFGHVKVGVGDPLFRLVRVSEQTAVIQVIRTHQNFTLHVRQPLTLAQRGAWKETLVLEPLGSAATITVGKTSTKH